MKRKILLSFLILLAFTSLGQNQTGKRYIPWLEANYGYINGSIGTKDFTSGFTGAGWQINNSGNAEFNNLTVRGSANFYELALQKIRSVNGGLVISAANAEVDSVSGGVMIGYTIYPKDTAITFMPNDLVRVQTWSGGGVKYYVGVVGSVDRPTHSFWMPENLFIGTDRPQAGDEMVQFGNLTDEERQGLLYLTAHDTYSPYMDVLDQVNSTDLGGKIKVRLGKLDGINSPTFGPVSGYGLYGSDVYLEGKLATEDGELISHHFAVTDNAFSVVYNRIDSAANALAEHETRLNMTPDSISLEAVWDSISKLDGRVSGAETAYEQTALAINLKADKSVTDSLGVVLDSAYARLALMPDSVSLETVYMQLDTMGNALDSIWTRIALTPDSISLQAVKDSLNELYERVGTTESQLVVQAGQIGSKVNQSEFNTLAGRVTTAESNITQTANQLASKVSTTTYESGMATKENAVAKSSSSPTNPYTGQLWINTSATPNILYRYNGSSWTKVTPTSAGEVGAYSSGEGAALAGRVSTAESNITQTANQLSSKVNQTDFNTLTGCVSTTESNISQTAGDVTFGFSRIGVDGYNRTGKTVIDASGLTVYDGGIKIKNKAGTDVLSADANGNLSITGAITSTNAAISGNSTIGNFQIYGTTSPGGIGYAGLVANTTDAYLRVGTGNNYAAIGTNTLPSTTGGMVATGYFSATSSNPYNTNYAVLAKASNSGTYGKSYAGYFDGILYAKSFSFDNIDPYVVTLPNAANYSLQTNKNLIVITSVNSNAGIYRIVNEDGSSPSNCRLLFITNASTTDLRIKANNSVSNGNILANGDDNWYIVHGTSAFMIYYGGYWRMMIDYGQ